LGDGLIRSGHRNSPIRIDKITPLKAGKRVFEQKFLHANYSAGVYDKTHRLQTQHASNEYLLARDVDDGPVRILLIYNIDAEWISQYFNFELTSSESVSDWLNRRFVSGLGSSCPYNKI
jgi:hypothetical protein